jgi:hypothetical protein
MRNALYLWLWLAMAGCQVEGLPNEGQPLDQATLWKAERIIPSQANYLLLEVKFDPADEESGRQLFLYNDSNEFVDGITLFGAVQTTESDRITINRTFNDDFAQGSVGFLDVEYVNLTRQSKGGGNAGSFVVDSLQYDSNTMAVTLFLRKPAEQFVTNVNEVGKHWSRFTIPKQQVVPLQDLDFEPTDNRVFSITGWIPENQTNSTTKYYLNDQQVLNKLFQQLIQSNGTQHRQPGSPHRSATVGEHNIGKR